MSINPAEDVRGYLDGNANLSLTAGTDLFCGPMRAIDDDFPIEAVFVKGSVGNPPARDMQESSRMMFPQVNIFIRSNSYGAASTLARSIDDEMIDPSISGYQDVEPLQSEPQLVGNDSHNNIIFLLSYVLKRDV